MRIISLSYLAWIVLLLIIYLMPRAAVAETASAITQDKLLFDVTLDGNPVGTQQVLRKRDNGNDTEQVSISTSLDVKLLFVTVYRYQHENRETWSSGCLQQIDASTDDNGKQSIVRGEVQAGSLRLTARNKDISLPGCVRTFAYWDADLLRAERLLNPQTGKYETVSYTELGQENTQIGGREVPARRVQLKTEKAVIDVWYANDDSWIALQSETKKGNVIRYELRQELTDA